MTIFFIPRADVEWARAHPFRNSRDPDGNAAIGRGAEDVMRDIVNTVLAEIPAKVESINSMGPWVPFEHRSTLCKEYRHDGLIFSGGQFLGVLEIKLACRPFFRLPDRPPGPGHEKDFGEWQTFDYCYKEDIPYFVAVGRLLNEATLEAEFLGLLNVNDLYRDHPELITIDDIKGSIYRRFQLVEIMPYIEKY